MNKQLSPITVFVGKNKRGTHNRDGYKDDQNQVYLPPKNVKGVEKWRQKMQAKGYTFG